MSVFVPSKLKVSKNLSAKELTQRQKKREEDALYNGKLPVELSVADLGSIAEKFKLSLSEVQRLHARFEILDEYHLGYLEPQGLAATDFFSKNPGALETLVVFQKREDDHITFIDFVETICQFTKSKSIDDKLDIIFKIYDRGTEDGALDPDEIFSIAAELNPNADPQLLQEKVIQTFSEMDPDSNGMIEKEDFIRFVKDNTIDLKALLSIQLASSEPIFENWAKFVKTK